MKQPRRLSSVSAAPSFVRANYEKTNGKKREGCHEGGRYKNILFILLEEPANNILEVKYTLITHAHTHTHVGFYGLRGLSIGVMVFILYKLYVLLPYTYPTPKPSPHRRLCISISPQKNSLCMIYKRFKLWGH